MFGEIISHLNDTTDLSLSHLLYNFYDDKQDNSCPQSPATLIISEREKVCKLASVFKVSRAFYLAQIKIKMCGGADADGNHFFFVIPSSSLLLGCETRCRTPNNKKKGIYHSSNLLYSSFSTAAWESSLSCSIVGC